MPMLPNVTNAYPFQDSVLIVWLHRAEQPGTLQTAYRYWNPRSGAVSVISPREVA